MKRNPLQRLMFVGALIAVLALAVPTADLLAAPDDDYKKHPGYVDFESMNVFSNLDATVEVFLKGALLKMARAALENDEPELAQVLAPIQLVRVNVFDLKGEEGKKLIDKKKAVAAQLDKKGWEMAVRIREDGEDVDIYILPGKDDVIEGLVVMVVEDNEEAVFVNVVGTIKPEDIGRIGQGLHIDVMDHIDYRSLEDSTKKDKRRSTRDRDR